MVSEVLSSPSREKTIGLFYSFLFSTLISFLLALKAPLWVLVLGPIFFGLPHIASVISYVPSTCSLSARVFSVRWIGLLFVVVASAHFAPIQWAETSFALPSNIVELIGALLIFVVAVVAIRNHRARLARFSWAIFLLSLLVVSSSFFLAETLGALVLIHNFVGFFYWIRVAKNSNEQGIACAALCVFTLLTGAILLGVFDNVMLAREKEILNGSLNEFSIGRFIFPHASSLIWNRAVSAFAFGQGVHYFVWLKAIPDRHVFSDEEFMGEHAASLKKNIRSKILSAKGGINSLIRFAFLGSLALFLYALLTSFAEARLVYLGMAAFHGYFEIVGLGFFDRARA